MIYRPSYKPYEGAKAAEYERKRKNSPNWQAEHRIVVDLLSKNRGEILDIPIGTGRFVSDCLRLRRPLLGMDVSEDMMSFARAKGARCRIGNVLSIPLPRGAVETALCIRLLNWLDDESAALAIKELMRVSNEVIFSLEGRSELLVGLNAERYEIREDFAIYRVRHHRTAGRRKDDAVPPLGTVFG